MSAPSVPLRVGVVGVGAMGSAHVRTLTDWVPGARVTMVFDAFTDTAAQVATQAGASVAASAEQLIASDQVDALVVATPDPLHDELALACLETAKPVLCEKPLATTVAGSRAIVDAEVTLGKRLVQVGFMRRFDPALTALRAAVVDGAVGTSRVVHCVHRNTRAHPSTTSEGIVVNSMIHDLDTVAWLLDDRVVAITVVAPPVADGQLRNPQVALLETAGGRLATVEVFVDAQYGYDIQCEVVGECGAVSLPLVGGPLRRRSGTVAHDIAQDFVDRFSDAYRIQLATWVGAVVSGRPIGPSAWDGHLANLAAAAGVESLRSGRRVGVVAEERPALYR